MKWLFLFLLVFRVLHSGPTSLFEEDDPAIYTNVNVISGHLSLGFLDAQIKGPIPYSIERTYSSAGSLERSFDDQDLQDKKRRGSGWMFQGGWTFLPHSNLYVGYWVEEIDDHMGAERETYRKYHKYAYGYERDGRLVEYRKNDGTNYFPDLDTKKTSNIDPRKDAQNNRFKFLTKRSGVLYTADGCELYYSTGRKTNSFLECGYWQLDLEILPSKQRVQYFYSSDKNLKCIELQDPSGKKVFGSIDFDHEDYEAKKILKAKTSEQQIIRYEFTTEFKKRNYLQKAQTSLRAEERFHYAPGRKGTGAQLSALDFGAFNQFHVEYYKPHNQKKQKKYQFERDYLPLKYDKVKSLSFPNPQTGEPTRFAEFFYHKEYTEVVDYEKARTKFWHDDKKLSRIEYFRPNGEKFSEVKIGWKDGYLSSKTFFDKDGKVYFSKQYTYDKEKNITEKRFKDDLSDRNESIHRLTYYPKTHLVKTEEIDGITTEYEYLKDTDLIAKKFIVTRGKIFRREFTQYDSSHLVTALITDDGSCRNRLDLSGVTERRIQRFVRDQKTGLCLKMVEAFYDFEAGEEKDLLTHHYTYSEKNEILEEKVVTSSGEKTFTMLTEYDNRGHITKKTTPLGRQTSFQYDKLGRSTEIKEVGKEKQLIEYDFLDRPKKLRLGDKTIRNLYDFKGRLIKQTDVNDNATFQVFDSFGRCIETRLPKVLDENADPYTPIIYSKYDVIGNPISVTNPKKETSTKVYNIYGKPTLITHPDGAQIRHVYHSNGELKHTIQEDGSKVEYKYDPLWRLKEKKLSKNGEIFSKESWDHNGFHMISYTDSLGLTTEYKYNAKGQKIEELAEGRSLKFIYDDLGNLEKTIQNGLEKVQIYNEEGEVVETWDADDFGKVENHTFYFYDNEGRKEKAHRVTSQAVAVDHFIYDAEGRLVQHLDPLNESSHFKYEKIQNNLGQIVNQKTIIDPLGNQKKEVFDANGKLVKVERLDPENKTVASEELFYDRAGNKAKRVSTVFEDNSFIRSYQIDWRYNKRGWVLSETEENVKTTKYAYDPMGRLKAKTLPSGVMLKQTYDSLGRLLSQKSSDHKIDYSYEYGKGTDPIKATDHIRWLNWTRTYNSFNELTSETAPNGAKLFWDYDQMGRCIKLTLPDQTSIEYEFEGLHMKAVYRRGAQIYSHQYRKFDENGHIEKEELVYNVSSVTTTHDLLERPSTQTSRLHTASIQFGPSGLVTKTENSFFGAKTYTHDPLNQLLKEGDKMHHFDSLGNPIEATVNNLNQITLTEKSKLIYNENGLPTHHNKKDDPLTYEYDPLNRLTVIHTPNQKHIQYIYDPFNRLYQKEKYEYLNPKQWTRKTHFYINDEEKEIGTYNENKEIQTLKVVGLGIKGEIGGAVAIEIEGVVYAPLHDFNGNIIALIHQNGGLVEKHDIDAFGNLLLDSPSITPWRFQSKRSEEHLVFFGLRFYSPELGRWLTPDPVGSLDSPNLYLYVHNSPMNRLDLFGLTSELFRADVYFDQPLDRASINFPVSYTYGDRYFIGAVEIRQIDHLILTPGEKQQGCFNLIERFDDLISKEGSGICFAIFSNGIGNKIKDFFSSHIATAKTIPGDAIVLSVFHPTHGILTDVGRVFKELAGFETWNSKKDRVLLENFTDVVSKLSPNHKLLWNSHSGDGSSFHRATKSVSKDTRGVMQDHVVYIGVAPSHPISEEDVLDARNIYSEQDYVTGFFGTYHKNPAKLTMGAIGFLFPDSKKYDIEFLKCKSTWKEKTMYFADHPYECPTYRGGHEDKIKEYGGKYGFYRHVR